MLTVLKILGIVLLAVLGLVILLLLIVLFVPLRVQAKVHYDGIVKARVHVGWLLRAVHAKFEWLKDHGLLRVKLLGLKTVKKKHIGDWGPEPAESEDAAGEKTEEAEGGSVPAEPGEEPASSDAPSSSAEKPEEKADKPEEAGAGTDTKTDEKTEGTGKTDEKPAGEAAGEASEAEEPWQPMHPIDKLEEKLDVFESKIDEIEELIYDEKNRKSLRLIGKQLKKIGRHLKPTKFLVEGELGFSDPAKTGKIMGRIYSLYAILGEHVRIEGNYEEAVTDLRGEIRCRIRLSVFIGAALRLLLDANLRRQVKKLLRKGKDKDNDNKAAGQAEEEKKAA